MKFFIGILIELGWKYAKYDFMTEIGKNDFLWLYDFC